MATATIHVECDDGNEMIITEKSHSPVMSGVEAALLVQQAFVKTARAFGVPERPPEDKPND